MCFFTSQCRALSLTALFAVGAVCLSGCKFKDSDSFAFAEIGGQKWMKKNLNIETEGSRCYGEGGLVQSYEGGEGDEEEGGGGD